MNHHQLLDELDCALLTELDEDELELDDELRLELDELMLEAEPLGLMTTWPRTSPSSCGQTY